MKPYYQDEWVTIYHGDCREILPSLDKVDLVLTDPPYDISSQELRNIWGLVASQMKEGANLLWTFNTCRLQVIGQSLIPELIEIRTAVWHKTFCPSPWRFGWSWHWEPIIWWMKGDSRKGISRYKFLESDVIPIDVIRRSDNEQYTHHHDQKPIELWLKLVAWFTDKDALVADPFMGAGTTLVASKKLNRKCTGIEIEEKYCEIAANRCRQMVFDLGAIK